MRINIIKISSIFALLLFLHSNVCLAYAPINSSDQKKPGFDGVKAFTTPSIETPEEELIKDDKISKKELLKPNIVLESASPENEPGEGPDEEFGEGSPGEEENPYIFNGEIPEGLIIPEGYEIEYVDVDHNGVIIEIGLVATNEANADSTEILESFDFGIYILREHITDTDNILHFSVIPKEQIIRVSAVIEITPIQTTELSVEAVNQEYQNCGPVALATVLNYYGEDIDPNDSFVRYTYAVGVDINTLVAEAEDMGYDARIVNNGTLEELAELIDAGVPVIVLGKYEGLFFEGNHYVVVTGYQKNEEGEITNIIFKSWGREYNVSSEEFSDWWSASITGNSVYVAIAPADSELAKSLPDSRCDTSLSSGLDIAEGASDITYAVLGTVWPFSEGSSKFIGGAEWSGNIVSAPFEIAGGVIRLLGGGAGKLFSSLGAKLDNKFGNFMTTIGTGVNNACSWIADGFEAASNFVSNTVSTVVDTVVDVVDTVVETVGNFFRGLFGG